MKKLVVVLIVFVVSVFILAGNVRGSEGLFFLGVEQG